jgi:hypothetical protein
MHQLEMECLKIKEVVQKKNEDAENRVNGIAKTGIRIKRGCSRLLETASFGL